MDGPAKFLIDESLLGKQQPRIFERLTDIYTAAANFSHELGTMRYVLKFSTLNDLEAQDRVFDVANKRLNSSMDLEGQHAAKGRPVALVIHPLAMVVGSYTQHMLDEPGEEVNVRDTVWFPAEVWLDIPPSL